MEGRFLTPLSLPSIIREFEVKLPVLPLLKRPQSGSLHEEMIPLLKMPAIFQEDFAPAQISLKRSIRVFCISTQFLLSSLRQSLQHQSNDVRLTAINTIAYVARKEPNTMDIDALKVLLPELITCTRDRNITVKSASESALVSVLALRDGDQKYKVSNSLLFCST